MLELNLKDTGSRLPPESNFQLVLAPTRGSIDFFLFSNSTESQFVGHLNTKISFVFKGIKSYFLSVCKHQFFVLYQRTISNMYNKLLAKGLAQW